MISLVDRIVSPPDDALKLLQMLHEAGFDAYVVGGCVRDSLLGKTPNDWDICTSAMPDEMARVFKGQHLVETGLKHGTLTVVMNHVPYEITTYRLDGDYTDHRHPDKVVFIRDLREDLRRRDFTVNAMAWSPKTGLVDCFGGQADLENGLIRCVGNANERFEEDALRILRALRFAAIYGFRIEEKTAEAARRMASTLSEIAAERIQVELTKLLCGNHAVEMLREFSDVITTVLPDLRPMVGFDQRTPYHRWDVWEHSIRAVGAIRPDPALRWTMLLHDSGKPAAFTLDDQGVGHAKGHQVISASIAGQVMDGLRMDRQTHDRVLLLVEKHDIDMRPEKQLLLRQLNRFGKDRVYDLIEVHRADRLAKGTVPEDEIEAWALEMRRALDDLLASMPCFSLKQLKVSGNDLMGIGFRPGKAMGEALNRLLEAVIDGDCANETDELLTYAKTLAHEE